MKDNSDFSAGLQVCVVIFIIICVPASLLKMCSGDEEHTYKSATHWQQAEQCYQRGDMEGTAYHIEKSPEDGSYPYKNRRP